MVYVILLKLKQKPFTDTTKVKYAYTGGYELHNWVIRYNDKNKNGKKQTFNKSTKTNSPTAYSGTTSLPPIGDSFLYLETISNIHGNNVFISWERTGFIQVSNITFFLYYIFNFK